MVVDRCLVLAQSACAATTPPATSRYCCFVFYAANPW